MQVEAKVAPRLHVLAAVLQCFGEPLQAFHLAGRVADEIQYAGLVVGDSHGQYLPVFALRVFVIDARLYLVVQVVGHFQKELARFAQSCAEQTAAEREVEPNDPGIATRTQVFGIAIDRNFEASHKEKGAASGSFLLFKADPVEFKDMSTR